MENLKLHAGLKWKTLFNRAKKAGYGEFSRQDSAIYKLEAGKLQGWENHYFCSDNSKQKFIDLLQGNMYKPLVKGVYPPVRRL